MRGKTNTVRRKRWTCLVDANLGSSVTEVASLLSFLERQDRPAHESHRSPESAPAR